MAKYPFYWGDVSKYRLAKGWKKLSPTCPAGFKFTDSDNTTHKLGEGEGEVAIVKPKKEWEIPEEYLTDAEFKDFHEIVATELFKLIKNNLPEVVYWTYADTQLLPEKINLEKFAANPGMCVPLKNMFHLAEVQEIRRFH